MSLEELRAALAGDDDQRARKAVTACGERLRDAGPVEGGPLVHALMPLARHPSATVRQAVADVCDLFPQFEHDDTLAILDADRNHYVLAAAKAAARRWAQRRKGEEKVDAEERALSRLLGELEDSYGNAARRLAERAVHRGVEHFMARLDHEVSKTRKPIALILGRLDADLRRPERGVGVLLEHAASLRERFAYVFSVIERARDYSRGVKPAFAEQSLRALVEEARGQLIDRLGPRASRLEVVIDMDEGLRPEVDRYAILQALQNLLQNAAEAYGDARARMTVRVTARSRRGASQVELRIADEGVGMTEDEQKVLFIPFGSRKPGGTGVGMLIVRKMIEDVHRGELSIESARGRGTTVTMVLPASQRGGRER